MELQELKQILQNNGIIGAGGAGFPSYAKLDKRIETILLNCAECEPLLKVHRQLLAGQAFEIIQALMITAQAVEAGEVIIAVKKAYTKTVDAVEIILNQNTFPIPVRIGYLPEIYPAGDEVITIYETTGKIVPPGRIPLDAGIAVFNVETMYNIYCALVENHPVTHKFLTIAGAVKKPKTVRVPVGMKISQVLELAGGVTVKDPVYIHGGPMTGPIVKDTEVITKTSNAILVLDKNHPVILKKTGKTAVNMKRAMASCCQCRMCTDLCPRNLLGHPIEPHAFMRAATSGQTRDVEPFLNTFFCSQCGLCEMYSCNQCLSPSSLIGSYKAGLRQAGITPPGEPKFSKAAEERAYRKVPMKRLLARLSLTEYDINAPLSPQQPEAKDVWIPCNQHIGAPAHPVVAAGDRVMEGQLIAAAAEGKLSVSYHASISGIVLRATESYVMITNAEVDTAKGMGV